MGKKSKLFYMIIGILLLAVFSFTGCTVKKADKGIRLGYLGNDLHQIALFVALDQGYFEEEGLKLAAKTAFISGPEEMNAFASGTLDIGYVGMAPAINSVVNNHTPVKSLALVNNGGSGIIVAPGSPIESIKDLRGKTVAVPGYGNVQDVLLRKAVTNANMTMLDVKTVILRPSDMIQALESGQIDAFVAWEPYLSLAIEKGKGRLLADSQDVWPGHPCCMLIGQVGLIEHQPQVVQAMLRIHEKATRFIKENPENVVIIGTKYTGLEESVVREALKRIDYQTSIAPEKVAEYLQILNQQGLISSQEPKRFLKEFLFN